MAIIYRSEGTPSGEPAYVGYRPDVLINAQISIGCPLNPCIQILPVEHGIGIPVENGTAVIAGPSIIPVKWQYLVGFCLFGHIFQEIGP